MFPLHYTVLNRNSIRFIAIESNILESRIFVIGSLPTLKSGKKSSPNERSTLNFKFCIDISMEKSARVSKGLMATTPVLKFGLVFYEIVGGILEGLFSFLVYFKTESSIV